MRDSVNVCRCRQVRVVSVRMLQPRGDFDGQGFRRAVQLDTRDTGKVLHPDAVGDELQRRGGTRGQRANLARQGDALGAGVGRADAARLDPHERFAALPLRHELHARRQASLQRLTDEGLESSYRAHRDAYERIFSRLGFDYRIVFAVSGAMGGSASEEFLAPTPSGEDTFVQCTNCDYAANTEAVEIAKPAAAQSATVPAAMELDTPDTPTIATLVDALNGYDWAAAGVAQPSAFTAADTLKNVVRIVANEKRNAL